MNNLLIAIAVFVITVVGALFAVPHFIDWNSYRSVFEEEARHVIGRTVEVDGDVKLHLLPTPYFRVEKVRIADPALSEGFFRAESLSIKLSMAPLLRGVVEANEIEFQRPVLRLALDAKGRWNWQSFARVLGETGYMPDNVALTSVRIRDGTLAFHGADGVERARLEGVNGKLSAPALQGPYVLRGTYALEGGRREFRLATGLPEAGQVPFRVSVHRLDNGASYLLDARAIDLMGQARVEGELTARLPIPAPSAADDGSAAGSKAGATPLEVKAAIKANVAGAGLSDLTLTFEQGDRPQTVTGHARAVWGRPVTVDMDLSSRWLDLDRLAGASEDVSPLASVTRLAAWLQDLLPGRAHTRLRIGVERANLAGEEIGPVRLSLARSEGRLEITELRTTLPGGSRGEMRGAVSATADALVFNGSLGLRGRSTRRFVAWATGGGLALPADADGPFDVRAGLTVGRGQATVQDLTGTLGGTRLKGGGRYRWAGRRELTATLEGPALDARGLMPDNASLVDLLKALAGRASAGRKGGPAAGNAVLRALQSDLDVRVRAGRLVTAARTYRDFTGAITMKGGHLRQLKLRLSGDDGYQLDLEGGVSNLAAAPKGALRGLVVAETAESIAPLAALLGIPEAFRPGDGRRHALVPLRLAGTVTLGARAATSADWTIDGEANGAAVKINARFDGGAGGWLDGGWRQGHAELSASVEARDGARLTDLLLPQGLPSARTGDAGPGRIVVRANGIPSQGLASLVSVKSAGLALGFRGRLHLTEAGVTADGDLDASARNGTALAALVGLAPTLRVDGVPIAARGHLTLDSGAVGMDQLTLQLGRSRLSGKIALSPAGDRRRIDATLNADDVSIAMLLGPLLDRRFGAASAAEAALTGRQSPWPDEPFSAPVLDAFEGRIRLSSRRLTLTRGLALDRARLDVAIEPGRIDVKEMVGATPGGQVKATLRIDKAAAGAEVHGALDFRFALDRIPGARQPATDGGVKGTVQFNGRGLSPRAVVSALQGRGKIAFDGASLPGLAPGAVAEAAEAALNGEADKIGATMRQTLEARLASASVGLGQATFPLEVVDGQVRSTSLLIDTSNGRISGAARLDLRALELTSEWRLAARPKKGGAEGRPLPPVIVSYRAPLAGLARAERQIDASALEQELSARRIERDIQELERLRRERAEAERRRRAEEEAERLRRAAEEAVRRRQEEAERLRRAGVPTQPAVPPAAGPEVPPAAIQPPQPALPAAPPPQPVLPAAPPPQPAVR